MKNKNATRIIRKLNQLNYRKVSYDHVKRLIRDLISSVPLVLYKTKPNGPIFRAVSFIKKPIYISQLGHPPPECITGYQRCNPPGKPVFYGSADPCTPIMEVGVHPGIYIYIYIQVVHKKRNLSIQCIRMRWK